MIRAKQVLQNLRTGETRVEELPSPGLGGGSVLIQTRASLISTGAERMLVEFGRASLMAKSDLSRTRSSRLWAKKVVDRMA